jgi:hypothetical protein
MLGQVTYTVTGCVYLVSHYINLLKMRRRLLYLKTQFVPRSKHLSSLVVKTNHFILYGAKVAIC